MDDTPFSGKVAVVTGATGGMGQEISMRLAEAGATVLAVDVKKPAAGSRHDELSRRIHYFECDIAVADAVRAAARRCADELGTVDLLVNAAGVVSVTRPVEAITDQEWAHLFGVNVTGAFHWMREVLPAMKEQRSGKIVNVSSRAGRTLGNFAGAHYSASKAAILGLTRQVALEAAPDNVHVNAIAPGLVQTPMLSGSVDESRVEAARAITPLRRIGTPTDIAELVLFLLSPASDWITGATVDINGGDLIL